MSEQARISFAISKPAHKALRFLAADWECSQQEVINRLLLREGAKWLPPDQTRAVPDRNPPARLIPDVIYETPDA